MRKPLLTSATVLLLAALGACSSGNTPAGPAPTSGAATSSSAAEARKLASATEFVTAVTAGMKAKKTATVTSSATNPKRPDKAKASSELRFEDGDKVLAKLTTEEAEGRTVVLSLPDASYLQTPEQASKTPGKPWLKIDPAGGPGAVIMLTFLARATEISDPSRSIDQLRTAGTLDSATAEAVEGTAATRYTITVDLAKVAAATTAQPAKAMAEAKVKQGATAVKHDIWLDANNVPLRWQTVENGKGGAGATVDARYDWGKPVEIAAPPANQVGQPG